MRGQIYLPRWAINVAGNIQIRKLAEYGTGLAAAGAGNGREMERVGRPTRAGFPPR
jgi:hypothetical protein